MVAGWDGDSSVGRDMRTAHGSGQAWPSTDLARLPPSSAVGNAQVTTGDAVQAAAALLIHAAHHRPLLPVAPLAMAVMVLLPTPKDYFGNAVRMLSVSLPPGTQQPAEHDAPGALRALASGIREATLRFRGDKVRAWEGDVCMES